MSVTIVRDIKIVQGMTYTESRILKVANVNFPNDRTKDTLMDLTGYSGRSQIRDANGAGEVIIECIVIVDHATSTVTRHIPPATSSAVARTAKNLAHDLELYTLNDADVIRLEQGKVAIDWEVTR